MTLFHCLVLAAFLPLVGVAQEAGIAPVAASDVVLADLLYLKRPVVVFANNPNDPNFLHQIEFLRRGASDLAARDVEVITDTDPATPSTWRLWLRPNGFLLVLLDKDGSITQRKPLPWDVREITRAIDKSPLARVEALEKHPAGR